MVYLVEECRSCRHFDKRELRCSFRFYGICTKDHERCVQVVDGVKFVFDYLSGKPWRVVSGGDLLG